MKGTLLCCLSALVTFSLGTAHTQTSPAARVQRNAGGRPVHNEAQRAARWSSRVIPYRRAGLSSREQRMIAKLADACLELDRLYWQQSDVGGAALYHATRNASLSSLFSAMGSRWDILDDNAPFIGEEPLPPGHELYPYGIRRDDIEQYAVSHPEAKAALYAPRTVVRGSPGELKTTPYHVVFAQQLEPAAADLREAAQLSSDAAFARYLTLSAEALLHDDYSASTHAWFGLKNPKIDLVLDSDDTGLDEMLGRKTSYGSAILVEDEAASRKLALFQKQAGRMREALPLPPGFNAGPPEEPMRIEVGVTPLRTGNLRYGYQDVAITVREDQNIDAKERTKAVIFNNLLDARLDTILIPLAQRMISPAQQTAINRDAYFTATVLQTIARELTSVNRGSNDKSQGFDPLSRSLGEARAGVVGVFLARWLAANRMISKREIHGVYVSYVADLLRTSRFGSGEPHGRAAMAQFNALVEVQAIRQDASGRYSVDDAAMPEAVSLLCKQLLAFGATGDDAGAAAWFAKYGSSAPAPLATALDAAKDLPVDFIPSYDLSHGDRP